MQGAVRWQAALVMAALAVSLEAGAQEATASAPSVGGGSFGQAGQIVISSDASGNLGYTTEGDGVGFLYIEPGADYFLRQNLSVGGSARLRVLFDDETVAGFGLSARVGYNLPVNDRVTVWPRASVTLNVGDDLFALAVPNAFGSDATVILEGYAPFLFHVTPHFFVGGGPRLAIGLGDDVELAFSVATTIGGYF